MDDATYTFVSDIKDKKSMLSGARSRKRGKKSKKCTLPSDHLTKGQLKKMNGEVKIYKMKEPMSWKEFKAMPEDYQETYLACLVDGYNVRLTDLGEMLGVTGTTLGKYVREHNFTKVKVHRGGGPMTGDQLLEWNKFLYGETYGTIEEDATPSPEVVEDIKNTEATETTSTQISNLSIGYDGDIRLSDVFAYVQLVLGDKFNGHLQITFNK